MAVRTAFAIAVAALATILVAGAAARPHANVGRAALAVSPNLVISQIYGGGGNSGAPYQNDFVELFNRGATAASLNGMSVQYASGTGTGNFGGAANTITPLPNVSVPAGGYILVPEASTAAVGAPLPAGDVTDATPIAMGAAAGKVALVNDTASLGCNGGSTPCDATATAKIVDLIGYGTVTTVNFYETAPAPAPSNTTADLRAVHGCTDTDNNSTDFATGAPNPRNSSTTTAECGVVVDTPPTVSSTNPAHGATGVAVGTSPTVTFSEPVTADSGAFTISCTASGDHALTVSGGPTTFTLDPATDFSPSENCTLTVHASLIHDQDGTPDAMAADYAATFGIAAPVTLTPIHDIQGAAHISPHNGETLTTSGIVTVRSTNGFWMQDPNPDADTATSEGIFVFTSSGPTAVVGDAVQVTARVQEFRPGGASTANLTTTELSNGPTVSVVSSGNPLPATTIVGTGGRVPPGEVIEDDATGDVETSGTFDPANDGIDFWESMEGMRVQINDAVASGPTQTSFGETPIVSDGTAGVRTPRGGVIIRPTDFNPERVILDDLLASVPSVNVGDHFTSPVVGVLDYNFGNFFIEATETPTVAHDGVTPESTTPQGPDQLAIATFNVENLDPGDGPAKLNRLAHIVVDNLKSPDIIGVEEVQDNDGATDSGNVDANVTLNALVSAIAVAGGPAYSYRLINPVNDQDGGEPGGNIRVVFLFRTDRGLSFVDAPGGGSTTPNAVTASGDLQFSPGRIDPTNPAFNSSRKPLAGQFLFRGQKLFVITNHFNSKGGDNPLMGHLQPPTFPSETQRHQQATILRDFVRQILAANPNGRVVELGDFNDFQFSQTVTILKDGGTINDMLETLPANEQYSYDFEGNSQTLDHILVSNGLFALPHEEDVVHVNSEFFDQASDHDPQVARFSFAPPTVPPGHVASGSFSTFGKSDSQPVTVANVPNRILVFVFEGKFAGDALSSVTYGGSPLTLLAVRDQRSVHLEIRYLVNPAAGSAQLAWSKTGANQNIVWGYSVYQGVNQSTPWGTPVSAGGTGDGTGVKSVVVDASSGDLVVDGIVLNGPNVTAAGPTAGSGQASRWSRRQSTTQGGSSDKLAASPVTMSWTPAAGTGVGIDWALIGAPLKPASGGGGPLTSTTSTQSSTTASDVAPGASVSDTAAVTGAGPVPTGSVTFFLCQPATVSANGGNCSTGGGQVGAAKPLDGTGHATSDPSTSTSTPGMYCWRAVYGGDGNYLGSSDGGPANECFTVAVPSGGGPVAFQAASSFVSFGSSDSQPVTVAAGTNRILVFEFAGKLGSDTLSSVTYGGSPLQLLAVRNQGSVKLELRYLVAPTVGTAQLAWSKTGAAQNISWGYSIYTGVNQATPFGAVVQAGASNDLSTTKSIVVAAGSGDVVVDAAAFNVAAVTASGPSAGAGQSQRWSRRQSTTQGGSSDKPGTASTTMSWTPAPGSGSGIDWALIGAPLKQA